MAMVISRMGKIRYESAVASTEELKIDIVYWELADKWKL
jgi:hypothetical protein